MTNQHPYWIGIGDIHGQTANLARIPELPGADAVIVTGDMTNRGGREEASRVIEAVTRLNPRVLAQIGNMDRLAAQEMLEASGMNLHGRVVRLAPGLCAMGVGWSAPTPFGTPSEVPDEQLGQWLREVHARVKDREALLLVCHNPPQGTAADRLSGGAHVGSPAVRAFIEEVQPQVCLTGHIHEARGEDRIGRTLVVNPGDLASGGYVRLDWDGSALSARVLTAGEAAL
ncbi:3',5'-cyclic adenosine monophosphate phosphodiesterase CpdA [Fundidesulfovibrio magnetotacticus]|uniref:3',5'-cyclic adenosine monophosphate phosphodiesterase CpdA n=1 Tax=Fundidesulfovibrio magnetotacticus TaxID=2730080 RepID=A0A6V8LUM1_9BACT|nr:metallophosphoesterase [Fundidesulfovibrio magnetotacticus]GFK93347.1 3',5'-cyclic adenosine monophosphate phosphodiesterase CpdA [Fundidesulfovibrio magnetotacticus]